MNAKQFFDRLEAFSCEAGNYSKFRDKVTDLMESISPEDVKADEVLETLMDGVRRPDMDNIAYVVEVARATLSNYKGHYTIVSQNAVNPALLVDRLQNLAVRSDNYAEFRDRATDLIDALPSQEHEADGRVAMIIELVRRPDTDDAHFIVQSARNVLTNTPAPGR